MQETQVQSLDRKDPLEKKMATHSSIAWQTPWTEEPGGLQSIVSQRVCVTEQQLRLLNCSLALAKGSFSEAIFESEFCLVASAYQ